MKLIKHEYTAWSVLWRSENTLDGKYEHLVYENCFPVMFRTRSRARNYITTQFGYIKERPDLRSEPHGWKIPLPVKISIKVVTK